MTTSTEHRLHPVRPQPTARTLLSLLLLTAVVVATVLAGSPRGLVHQGGRELFGRIASSLLAPDLSGGFLLIVLTASLLTLAYAIAGMTVAVLLGFPGALLVSGVLVPGRFGRLASSAVARTVFGALRAIHELVWALLFLTILGLTPVAGILAIGVPYGATLARVLGEHLQNVPQEPVDALVATGASRWQILCYGRLPLAGGDVLAYLAYRFECAIRAAAVLSFIGLGGIGYRLTLALSDLRFDRVWPLLAALVLMIGAIDVVSGRARRLVQA